MVIKEAVRVTEAVVLGSMVDASRSIPDFMRTLLFKGNAYGPLVMNDNELKSMIELRDRVFRIWGLLRTSENFDPALLQPILQVSCCFSVKIPFMVVLSLV